VDVEVLRDALRREGFAFVPGGTMQGLLRLCGPLDDWHAFAASWDRLGPDPYLLAAAGRLRKRRHAVYAASGSALDRQPHQPHYQSRDYNALQGGIERWFEPVTSAVGDGECMRTVIRFGLHIFGALATAPGWRIEVHQFRIEASPGDPGDPTPEGSHRDGVDYVLVLMVDRLNMESGATTIASPDGTPLGEFTLSRAFDTALVDDHRVYHGVTPVSSGADDGPSHRDVLVVTYRRA
jgi:hypothetical protein